MLEYMKSFFITIFYNVMQWFDTMMIDTGHIVWIGTAFLMIASYRFIIRPLFGVLFLGDIVTGKSDSNKNFSKRNRSSYTYKRDSDGNLYRDYRS